MAVPPNTIKALDHICNCGMDHSGARRHFLRTATAAAALAGIAASAAAVIAPRRALAQAPLTPDAALKELMDGNQRYIQERMTAPQHDLEILHAKAAEKQEPFAAVLSCADSRVPVELLFDQTIGHLFVCRVARNVSTPEIIASLEYGAAAPGPQGGHVAGPWRCAAVTGPTCPRPRSR